MRMIRKNLSIGVPLTSVLLATSALAAESGSAALSFNGTAQHVCQMPDPSTTSQSNASVQNKTVTVDNLISLQDATVRAWEATLTFAQVMCNYAAYVSLQSQNGGMKPDGDVTSAVGGEFLTKVDYTVTAKWGNVPDLILNTAVSGTTAVQRQATGANKADLIVSIATSPSTAPLVQGDFHDTLIVKVGPSI